MKRIAALSAFAVLSLSATSVSAQTTTLPEVDGTGDAVVTMLTFETAEVTPGFDSWIAITWTGDVTDAREFRVTSEGTDQIEVGYPSNTDDHSSLYWDDVLSPGEVDYTALRLTVDPGVGPFVMLPITLSYVSDSGPVVVEKEVVVPVDGTSPGDGGLVYEDGLLGSLDADATGWMDFGVTAVVDASNVTVVVEDAAGFGVVYPFDADSSELSTGSSIHDGESDYARVRFSADGINDGTYEITFGISYFVGGDLRTDRVVRSIRVGDEVIVTTTTTAAPTTTTTEAPTTTTTEATTTTTERVPELLFGGADNSDWTFDPYGTDSATTGQFELGLPELDMWSGVVNQPDGTPSGQPGLVTTAQSSQGTGLYDIDGGETSALSRVVAIPASGSATLSFQYYFSYLNNSRDDDFLMVSIVAEDGATETLVNVRGDAQHVSAVWTEFSTSLAAYAGQDIQILVQSADNGRASLVESAVAEFDITG